MSLDPELRKRIHSHLNVLYPHDAEAVLDRLEQLLGQTQAVAPPDELWSERDVVLITSAALVVLIITMVLFKEFRLLSFDREFAASQGQPVFALDVLMMGLLVVVTVVGLPAVGVVLMAAMLIIPGAAARFWTERLAVCCCWRVSSAA